MPLLCVLLQLDLSKNQLCGLNWEGKGTYTAEGIRALADAVAVNASLTQVLAFCQHTLTRSPETSLLCCIH